MLLRVYSEIGIQSLRVYGIHAWSSILSILRISSSRMNRTRFAQKKLEEKEYYYSFDKLLGLIRIGRNLSFESSYSVYSIIPELAWKKPGLS